MEILALVSSKNMKFASLHFSLIWRSLHGDFYILKGQDIRYSPSAERNVELDPVNQSLWPCGWLWWQDILGHVGWAVDWLAVVTAVDVSPSCFSWWSLEINAISCGSANTLIAALCVCVCVCVCVCARASMCTMHTRMHAHNGVTSTDIWFDLKTIFSFQ